MMRRTWWGSALAACLLRNINSTTFGRLTAVNVGARVVQLSARFNF
jgi:hypothetical protein